jgi:hypothetical protein
MDRPHDRVLIPLALVLTGVLCGCGDGARQATDLEDTTHENSSSVPQAAPSKGESAPGPETSAATEEATDLGPPLEHPELYYGLFANPETPNRQWFVAEAKRPWYAEQAPEVPPGHLALGAMFGDVEPWYLKALSGTEFEQARVPDQQAEPVAVRFELDDDGKAIAMTFTDEQTSSEGRLERVGDLPDDWQ